MKFNCDPELAAMPFGDGLRRLGRLIVHCDFWRLDEVLVEGARERTPAWSAGREASD